jgi:hypothetical protein
MSNAAVVVPQCTHVKTNGEVCGSPAVTGTEFCYHHSAVKTALAKGKANGTASFEGFAPIPFVFPEDRASMQINFFLLLQAFNEQQIDQKIFRLMLSMLKAMAKNLGKTGSLLEEASDQHSAASGEAVSDQGTGNRQKAIGNSNPVAAVSKKISVQASASAEVFPTPIAPESCFSTKPPARSLTDIRREVFRTSALHPAGQRTVNRYFAPLPER